MQVQVRATPSEVDVGVSARVTGDVTAALQAVTTVGSQFVINDTPWLWKNPQGAMRPQVVNSAKYLSVKFQAYLHTQKGWDKEKTLAGQTIDAHIELPCPAGHQLDKSRLTAFLDEYTTDNPEASVDDVFFRYVKRSCLGLSTVDPKYHHYFGIGAAATRIRIGLEFETGNIASSFRSLNKLNFLFRKGQIDSGVFITSRDKDTTSARIWPMSNRNGSFQELEQRNYRETISFPVWEFAFAPDSIDRNAPYLGKDGTTFVPVNTGRTVAHLGKSYQVWTGDDGRELFLPI